MTLIIAENGASLIDEENGEYESDDPEREVLLATDSHRNRCICTGLSSHDEDQG